MELLYKIIKYDKFEKFLNNHPKKETSIDKICSRATIEENKILTVFNITDIKELYSINPPIVVKARDIIIKKNIPSNTNIGFVFISYFANSDEIITFGCLAKIDFDKFFPYSKNPDPNITDHIYGLFNIVVDYNFRNKGLCKKMVTIMLDACTQFYKHGIIYLESVSMISSRCYMAVDFIPTDKVKGEHNFQVFYKKF